MTRNLVAAGLNTTVCARVVITMLSTADALPDASVWAQMGAIGVEAT